MLALAGCGDGGPSEQTEGVVSSGQQGESTADSDGTKSSPAAGGDSTQTKSAKQSGSHSSASSRDKDGRKQGSHVTLPPGEPEPTATPAEQAEATVADIVLASPALGSSGEALLPPSYTCDGENTSPSLEWQGVPDGTAELVLFAMNVQPVEGRLFFDWAVAGISPNLTSLRAGKLPEGAVQGTNGFGHADYSICPPPGQAETYVFALYALPKRLSPAKGFDPRALREAAQAASAHAGLLAATYARG